MKKLYGVASPQYVDIQKESPMIKFHLELPDEERFVKKDPAIPRLLILDDLMTETKGVLCLIFSQNILII